MALNLTETEVADAYANLLPKLVQRGPEWRGVPCPIHGGDDPENFVVNAKTGAFRCFSGGCKGDVVDVAKVVWGLATVGEALDAVKAAVGREVGPPAGGRRSPKPSPPPPPAEPPTHEWAGPLPYDACPPQVKTWRGKTSSVFDGFGRRAAFKQVKVWPYYDAQGKLLRLDVRQEAQGPDGSIAKDVVPFTVWRDCSTGTLSWKQKDIPRELPNSRPLWGLPDLAQRPEATVLVCEGCKAAEAAQGHFPELVCVSWVGGAERVGHANWEALAGRRVVFWPDADQAGRRAAQEGAKAALAAGATSAAVVRLPEGAPEGWDLADELPEGWELAALLAGAEAEAPASPTAAEVDVSAGRLPENVAGKRVAEVLRWRICYDEDGDTWWAYQPERGAWSEAPRARARRLVFEAIGATGCAPKGYGDRYVGSVLGIVAMLLRTPEAWGEAEAFTNGVLENGILKPHDPKRLLVFTCPFAWAPGVKPELVLAFLLQLANGDHQVVQVFRAFITCLLRGKNPGVFLELQGAGSTGKSTFVNLLLLLIGRAASCSTSLPTLEGRPFELANARGKRLVLVNDADDYRGGVSNLKQLTGEDAVRAEVKGKQSTPSFRFNGVVIITANKPLRSSDYSSGLARRRITHTPLSPVPASERRDMEAEFKPLLPGVYDWAMELSAEEAVAILRTARDRVASIAQDTRAAEEEANPIAAWALANLWLAPGLTAEMGVASLLPARNRPDGTTEEPHYKDHTTKLYPSYCQWAKTAKLSILSLTRFGGDLQDLLIAQWRLPGVERVKNSAGLKVYRGIALQQLSPASRPLREFLEAQQDPGHPGHQTSGVQDGCPDPQSKEVKGFQETTGRPGHYFSLLHVEKKEGEQGEQNTHGHVRGGVGARNARGVREFPEAQALPGFEAKDTGPDTQGEVSGCPVVRLSPPETQNPDTATASAPPREVDHLARLRAKKREGQATR